MANVKIPYQPELTAAQAMTIFADRFRGQYEICKTRQRKRDFAVKKNWSTAVSVGLRQEPGTTEFIVTGCGSSPVGGIITGVGLVTIVLFWKYLGILDVALLAVVGTAAAAGLDWILFGAGRKALESEVVVFVENAADLWAPRSPSRPSPGAVLPSALVSVQPAFCTSCGAALAGQARFYHACGTPASSAGPDRQPSCTVCGGLLGENARFCKACGAPVSVAESEAVHAGPDQLYCQQCRTEVPQSNLFCHKCGAEVASAKRGNLQIIGAASKPTSEAATRRGYCQRCGQELGVKEKMRGLTVHERCTELAPVTIAASPINEPPEAQPATIAAPVPAPTPGPKVPGRCDLCGEELGVDEKLVRLAVHRTCPQPVVEDPKAVPAQPDRMYCGDCGTPMPRSSRFCHKCGSAVVAAAE